MTNIWNSRYTSNDVRSVLSFQELSANSRNGADLATTEVLSEGHYLTYQKVTTLLFYDIGAFINRDVSN